MKMINELNIKNIYTKNFFFETKKQYFMSVILKADENNNFTPSS